MFVITERVPLYATFDCEEQLIVRVGDTVSAPSDNYFYRHDEGAWTIMSLTQVHGHHAGNENSTFNYIEIKLQNKFGEEKTINNSVYRISDEGINKIKDFDNRTEDWVSYGANVTNDNLTLSTINFMMPSSKWAARLLESLVIKDE